MLKTNIKLTREEIIKQFANVLIIVSLAAMVPYASMLGTKALVIWLCFIIGNIYKKFNILG
jgi:hypothetical protein